VRGSNFFDGANQRLGVAAQRQRLFSFNHDASVSEAASFGRSGL